MKYFISKVLALFFSTPLLVLSTRCPIKMEILLWSLKSEEMKDWRYELASDLAKFEFYLFPRSKLWEEILISFKTLVRRRNFPILSTLISRIFQGISSLGERVIYLVTRCWDQNPDFLCYFFSRILLLCNS